MRVSELLRAARLQIVDPERWAPRDVGGLIIDISNPGALMGPTYSAEMAVLAVDKMRANEALHCLAEAADHMGYLWIHELEWKTDHVTVLRMYDEAISMAERGNK